MRLFFCGGGDESHKDGMRSEWPSNVLWMELSAHKERMIGELDGLYQ